jgi:hypothetical protein
MATKTLRHKDAQRKFFYKNPSCLGALVAKKGIAYNG